MTVLQMMQDEELMASIAVGDGQAFDVLVRRHLPRAYSVARRVLHTREDAEEAAQDAFSKIWVKAGNWKPERGAKFTTWFYRIIVNSALDLARKKQGGMVANAEEILKSIADDHPDSETRLMQQDEEIAVRAAIDRLTPPQRAAITLTYFEQHTNMDAAAIMGVNIKALEGLLVRARKTLREQLSKTMKESRHAA